MPRPISKAHPKTFLMDEDILFDYQKARIQAQEDHDEEFPDTLRAFLNQAGRKMLNELKATKKVRIRQTSTKEDLSA